MSSTGHLTGKGLQAVPRFQHGSRVPGWDDAADLTKDPAGVPDPAVVEVPADLRAEIEDFMSRYPDSRSAAIPALRAAQERHGWCSPEAVEQVACVMRLTPGYLASVAGFYDQLETRPVGHRPVYVCTNISCSLRGADNLLAELQHELAGADDVNLRGFECLGACDIAPMVSVEGVYVGPVDEAEIPELARQIRAGEDPLPAKQLIRRPCQDPGAAAPE
ncbi:MAG: NADH-quinone oxidoreductase subunit [Solirubrobacterales bacterium]|nr:NADH-quinone oxidoreductase subunit [Solirubrobacterales bacterium]